MQYSTLWFTYVPLSVVLSPYLPDKLPRRHVHFVISDVQNLFKKSDWFSILKNDLIGSLQIERGEPRGKNVTEKTHAASQLAINTRNFWRRVS